MVEVFKTNVERGEEATELLEVLVNRFPLFKINFDLEDCDKILRVKGKEVEPNTIIRIVKAKGFECFVLE